MVTIEVNSKEYNGDQLWREEAVLRELYTGQEHTQSEIGEMLGCESGTVSKWLSRYDIDTDAEWDSEEKLRELYCAGGLSAAKVAERFGCSPATIQKALKRHEIERRSIAEALKTNCRDDPDIPINMNADGYMVVEHQYDGERFRVRVSRLVAIAEYGYNAVVGNHVHHKNMIPWLDYGSNIEVIDASEHPTKHQEIRLNRPSPPHQDEDVLFELYWVEDFDQQEMADKLGCDRGTVKNWMETHELRPCDMSKEERRQIRAENPVEDFQDGDVLNELYHERGLGRGEVAGELGCSKRTVGVWLAVHELRPCDMA